MNEWIPAELVDFTPAGLLGLFILLLMLGRIHTNTAYQTVALALEKEREVNRILLQTTQLQASTIDKQTVYGDFNTRVMSAIKQESESAGNP